MKSDLKEPQVVKHFMAILVVNEEYAKLCNKIVSDNFREIDYSSELFPFYETKFYEKEMGNNLFRYFVSFKNLISPQEMVEIKLKSNELEELHRIDNKRMINLDTGYLDFNKVVLASTKFQGQKIYISSGIYADLILYYRKGSFTPFEWSFPDFKNNRYYDTLLKIRTRYKEQMKLQSAGVTG